MGLDPAAFEYANRGGLEEGQLCYVQRRSGAEFVARLDLIWWGVAESFDLVDGTGHRTSAFPELGDLIVPLA